MPAQTPEEEIAWFERKIESVKGRGAAAKKAHYRQEIERVRARIEREKTGHQTTHKEYEHDMRERMGASTRRKSSGSKSSGSKSGGRRRRRSSRHGRKTRRGRQHRGSRRHGRRH